MREYRLISFQCYHCGIQIKASIGKGTIIFSINNKLYNVKDVLSDSGYYVCIDCHKRTNIRFEYVYE
jgi:hypothetical protein